MSGTDKTKPYYVKLWDGDLRRVAVHDHRFGPCTLPLTLADLLVATAPGRALPRTGCFWDLRWTGIGVCPCSLCTGRPWRRQDVRRERRTVKERLRGVRTVAARYEDDTLADL